MNIMKHFLHTNVQFVAIALVASICSLSCQREDFTPKKQFVQFSYGFYQGPNSITQGFIYRNAARGTGIDSIEVMNVGPAFTRDIKIYFDVVDMVYYNINTNVTLTIPPADEAPFNIFSTTATQGSDYSLENNSGYMVMKAGRNLGYIYINRLAIPSSAKDVWLLLKDGEDVKVNGKNGANGTLFRYRIAN
jgi:hypothetical protein